MSKFLTIPQWYDLNGALCTGYSANVGNANTPVYVKDGNIVAANKYGLQDVQGVIPADIKTTIDQTLYTIFRRTAPPATGYVTIGDISSKFLNLLSSYNLSGIYSVDGAETEGIYVLNSMSKYEKQGINYIYTDILKIDNSGTYKLSLYLRIYFRQFSLQIRVCPRRGTSTKFSS